jgi:hypothetical protein
MIAAVLGILGGIAFFWWVLLAIVIGSLTVSSLDNNELSFSASTRYSDSEVFYVHGGLSRITSF